MAVCDRNRQNENTQGKQKESGKRGEDPSIKKRHVQIPEISIYMVQLSHMLKYLKFDPLYDHHTRYTCRFTYYKINLTKIINLYLIILLIHTTTLTRRLTSTSSTLTSHTQHRSRLSWHIGILMNWYISTIFK